MKSPLGHSNLSTSSVGAGLAPARGRRSESRKLARKALAIEAEEARAAGALGFMTRLLVRTESGWIKTQVA